MLHFYQQKMFINNSRIIKYLQITVSKSNHIQVKSGQRPYHPITGEVWRIYWDKDRVI